MKPKTRDFSNRDWLPLALGLVLALVALELVRTRLVVKLEEAALGQDTQFAFGAEGDMRTLCMDGRDTQYCINAYERAERPPAVLWLGNSQLAAINRLKSGDRATPIILHDMLRARGNYLVTYAQPNANLLEHSLAFASLRPLYQPRLLILPVFLDDIREQGIRHNIADLMSNSQARTEAERSAIWPHIAPNVARNAGEHAALEEHSLQREFENALNGKLSEWWPLWRSRPSIRGLLSFSLHVTRNRLLGINAQTKRRVDPAVYAQKMAALDAILAHAGERKIKVLLYIPPFRLDIPGPYVEAEYARLKIDLVTLAGRHGAHFANLENVVPGPEWGNVVDAVFGFEDYDFMHFTGEGHRRHAEALDRELRRIGF